MARRHHVFYVGPQTPFRNDFYRDLLGLRILVDGSHPDHLEVHEECPTWIPDLFEFQRIQGWAIENNTNTKTLSEFVKQIKNHLSALREIGSATDGLIEAVEKLSRLLEQLRLD